MSEVGAKTRTFIAGEIKEAVDAASWRWKALDVAVKIAMPILLGVSAWTATTLMDLDKRVEIIEATRYTQEDARTERDGIKDALRDIKVILARQEASTEELKKAVGKLEAKVESLSR